MYNCAIEEGAISGGVEWFGLYSRFKHYSEFVEREMK